MGLIVTANGLLVTEAHCSNCRRRLGVDFQVKTIRVDDRNIAIQLWDTAGTNIGGSFQKIKCFLRIRIGYFANSVLIKRSWKHCFPTHTENLRNLWTTLKILLKKVFNQIKVGKNKK